jgi:signal transduction histidine kinase
VSNSGPLLPPDTASLFESMVSFREGGQQGEHLGLGLYIARLITEFHLGTISASNRPDQSGVVMQVVLPVARG